MELIAIFDRAKPIRFEDSCAMRMEYQLVFEYGDYEHPTVILFCESFRVLAVRFRNPEDQNRVYQIMKTYFSGAISE